MAQRKQPKKISISDNFRLTSSSHSFNVSLAAEIGLVESILLQSFSFWHDHNSGIKDMNKDNRVWCFISISKMQTIYPYLSADKIRNAIERLILSGFLIKGDYNKSSMVKANWYSLSDKSLKLFGKEITEKDRTIQQITEPFSKSPNHSANHQQDIINIDNKNIDNYSPSISPSLADAHASDRPVETEYTEAAQADSFPTGEREKEKSSAKKEKEKDDPYTFDKVWDLYDKKVGDKEKLRRKWEKLSLAERRKAFEHIPLYREAQPDKKYRRNFETYLNNKGWNDEIIREGHTDNRRSEKRYCNTMPEDFEGKGYTDI